MRGPLNTEAHKHTEAIIGEALIDSVDARVIDTESGVGRGSRLGYVRLRWGEQSGQLTTREARVHALKILDAAAAADHDAAVFRWLIDELALTELAAAQALGGLREARKRVDRESGNE